MATRSGRGPRLLVAGLLLLALTLLGVRLLSRGTARPPRPGGTPEAPAAVAGEPAAPGAVEGPAEARREEAAAAPESPPEPDAFEPDAVYGVVLDDAYEPVAGASVRLLFERGSMEALAETTSDEGGRFRLRGREPGIPLWVEARRQGGQRTASLGWPGVAMELVFGPTARMRGRVLDADSRAPVSGARVIPRMRVEDGGTVSDAEGRYELVGLSGSLVRVLVGRADGPLRSITLRLDPDREDGYDLLLEDDAGVTVQLVDSEEGTPLANVEVSLDAGLPVRTDAEGRFLHARTGAEAGTLSRFRVPGRTTTVRTELTAPGPVLVVPNHRGMTLRGRVLDPEGGAVSGAVVSLWPDYQGGTRPLSGPFEARTRTSYEHTTSSGEFRLAGFLPTGPVTHFWVEHPAYLGRNLEVEIDPSVAEIEIEVTLERGAELEGEITAGGVPLSVPIRWSGGGSSGRGQSNDRGRFLLRGLPLGEVSVYFVRPGSGVERSVWIEPRRQLLDVELPREELPIEGRITRPDGTPLDGVPVVAYDPRDQGFVEHEHETRSGPDGSFRLLLPESDRGVTHGVRIGRGVSRVRLQRVVPGGPPLDIVLPELGRLELVLVDGLTGRPVGASSVQWTDPTGERDGGSGLALSGADGVGPVDVPAGTWDLQVTPKDLRFPTVVLEGLVIAADVTTRREVALEPGVACLLEFGVVEGELYGMLYGVQHVGLWILREGQDEAALGNPRVRESQRVRIGFRDRRARAELRAIEPGTWRLHAASDQVTFTPSTFEVPPGERATIEVRVEPTAEDR